MSSPTSASSSAVLPMASVDLLPRGSSRLFFSGFAGAVAEKAVVVLQLEIEAVDVDRRQTGGAVRGDARCRDDIFGHFALPGRKSRGQRRGNPLVSHPGRRGSKTGYGGQNALNPSRLAGFKAGFP
jgi:hypothetical protein